MQWFLSKSRLWRRGCVETWFSAGGGLDSGASVGLSASASERIEYGFGCHNLRVGYV